MLNNPIRFNDPTGHVCSDPEDPTPTCDGSGGPPPNTPVPLPSSPVGITDPDPLEEGLEQDKPENDDPEVQTLTGQCTNILGEYGGCANYFSLALGLDTPTIMMLLGLGLSYVGLPQAGAPLALSGAVFEVCAFSATPLCAAVKLLSVNISGTIDQYGNLYIGPQISWGKSILPFVAISDYVGVISSGNNPHVPTESETRDTLSGFSVSVGSIATGGVSYSPLASTYQTTYYLDGFPEVFSVNVNYNFQIYDFSP